MRTMCSGGDTGHPPILVTIETLNPRAAWMLAESEEGDNGLGFRLRTDEFGTCYSGLVLYTEHTRRD